MPKVRDIFSVRYGHSLELNGLNIVDREHGIAFVSRKMGDNGISAYVAPIPNVEPAPSGDISCALGGNGVLTTHLQEQPFYVGRDVAILRSRLTLTKSQILYYCLCIKSNRFRFSYGRQANRTLKDLPLPALDDFPTWVAEAKADMFAGSDAAACSEPPMDIRDHPFRSFRLSELFNLRKGRRLTKTKMTSGNTPYIGATDSNNGVTAMIGQTPLFQATTITVSYDGSIGEAFYQEQPYWASDAVNVLEPKFIITTPIALYLCTAIRQEKYRFNYGRKWHLDRMNASVINLPVDSKGLPDWNFMTMCIERLPFSSQLA